MDAQFKKGVLEMCILYTLAKDEMYGYEIMRIVKNYFPDVYDGTIYTVLRRLASDGYLDFYIGETSDGPKRKYYFITENGNIYLNDNIEQWKSLCSIVQSMGII